MAAKLMGYELLNTLCEVFELPKYTRKVTLTADVTGPAILTVEHFPTNEQGKRLGVELERIEYELVDKERALVG